MRAHDDILNSFIARRFGEGQQIPKSYFWDLFGLEEPRGVMHVATKEKQDFAFMGCMDKLKDALLEEHFSDLQSVGKKKYVLVPHQDRIRAAVTDTSRTLKKALKKGTRRLTNIAGADNLSYTEQRHRDFALQMFDAMKRDLRATPRYPKP